MPSHEEHCRQSFERYGKRFDELHTWMDEPSAVMGRSHRMHRHDPYKTPKEALERFGHMADHACLDHIKLDKEGSARKGISIRRAKAPQISSPLAHLFYSLMCFVIGVLLISQPFISWGGIVFFFFSFLLFLAFLGSLSETDEKTVTVEMEMKGKTLDELEKNLKTLSSLETNEKKNAKESVIAQYMSGDLDKIGIFDVVTIMTTCTKCGEEFDAKLKTCPRCRGMTFCFNCGEWYEGESCSKCVATAEATTTCLHCGLEYDGAQGICPRCGVAIGFTDYDEG